MYRDSLAEGFRRDYAHVAAQLAEEIRRRKALEVEVAAYRARMARCPYCSPDPPPAARLAA